MAVIVYVFIFPHLCFICDICQFQGFLFGAILVQAHRPRLCVHRQTIGVLKGSPQCGLIGFGLYLGVEYCKGFV